MKMNMISKKLAWLLCGALLLSGFAGWGQLNPGDIALIAYNGDGDDDIAFVALVDIPASTSIWFTDNEWTGTAFNDLNEGRIEWTYGSVLSAGSVVVINNTSNSGSLSTTIGNVSMTGTMNLNVSNESVFALLQEPSTSTMSTPGFLGGIANDLNGSGATLTGTGLTLGTNYLDFGDDNDGYVYNGSRSSEASFGDYLPLIMNTANYQIESTDGTQILPISSVAFTTSSTPTVGWDAASSSETETDVDFDVDIPVTMSNWSQQVIVDIAVTGGSAESGDYTLNTSQLTFNGDGTQNVNIDINDDADVDDETIELTITENTSTGVTISTAVHTITVTDDEIPTVGWQIDNADQLFTIDFESTVNGVNQGEFDGSGFTSSPSTGQLDSDAWATSGASDGSVSFGGTGTSGDFALGVSSGGVGTGGVYAFDVGSSNYALGIQQTTDDYTSGSFTLRSQNQTSNTATTALVAYTVYIYNDQGRSSDVVFAHSTDDVSYTDVSTVTVLSTEAADPSPAWEAHRMVASLTGLNISDEGFFYLRWTFDDVGGSGSRDEIAIDDIQMIFNPSSTQLPALSGTFANLVNDGADLEINANNTLTVEGDLTNNGTLTLNANSTQYAQLKVDGAISGTGTVTLQQYLEAGWHDLAAIGSGNAGILGNIGTNATGATANTRNLYTWNATTQSWDHIADNATSLPSAATGMIGFVGTHGIQDAAGLASWDYVADNMFESTTAVTLVNNTSSGDPDIDGWNFVANPYPCAFDPNTLNLGSGNAADIANGYSIRNSPTTYFAVSSISGSTQKIAPGQGFWVKTDGGTNVDFPATTMENQCDVNETPEFYKNQTIIADRFHLETYEAADYSKRDVFLLGMVAGAQDGIDNQYDAPKRMNTGGYPNLMSIAQGTPLAINAIDYSPNNIKTKKLQMRFVSGKNNEIYFIELQDSLLSNNYHIELEDLKLRKMHDLKAQPYKFVHDQNAEYRFVLHLSPVTTVNSGHSHSTNVGFGYGINTGTLVLKLDNAPTDVAGSLHDLNGRRVMELRYPAGADQHGLDVSTLASGVYVLKLQTAQGEEVHKIILP